MYSSATLKPPILPSKNDNAVNIIVKYINTNGLIFLDKNESDCISTFHRSVICVCASCSAFSNNSCIFCLAANLSSSVVVSLSITLPTSLIKPPVKRLKIFSFYFFIPNFIGPLGILGVPPA